MSQLEPCVQYYCAAVVLVSGPVPCALRPLSMGYFYVLSRGCTVFVLHAARGGALRVTRKSEYDEGGEDTKLWPLLFYLAAWFLHHLMTTANYPKHNHRFPFRFFNAVSVSSSLLALTFLLRSPFVSLGSFFFLISPPGARWDMGVSHDGRVIPRHTSPHLLLGNGNYFAQWVIGMALLLPIAQPY